MEHVVESSKQAGPGSNVAAHRRSAAGVAPALHPALQLQQQAGNQAMQELLRARVIRAKLEVSQPGDPEEQEADEVAGRIMRSAAGVGAASSSACSCGSGEEEMCDECRQKAATISRKSSTSGRPASSAGRGALNFLERSAGDPLDRASRDFFEPRFGRDLSGVRVHAGTEAAASARSIQAHAYASGEDLVFNTDKYAPHSEDGRHLLAHELAHVMQGNGGIQRQTDDDDDGIRADPTDTESWKTPEDEDPDSRKYYEENLKAAPQASLDLEKDLKNNPTPADDDHDHVIQQIRTLIRMNAVGLMASNRAHVEYRRDELLNKPGSVNQDSSRESHGLFGGGAGADASAQTEDEIVSDPETVKNADAVRAAAKTAVFLNEKKEKFEDSARAFDLEAGSQMRWGGDSFNDAFKFMFDESAEYRSPEISSHLNYVLNSLKGKQSIERGVATSIIFSAGRYLAEWRRKQANGAGVALDRIYEQFPFFGQLAPGDVPKEWEASSAEVMDRVRDAYGVVMSKIDEVIVKIGAEDDIDPYDLPEAVKLTRDSLSSAQQQILDQAMQDRKEHQFWLEMGLTLAQMLVVFIPVVGPALAVGIGAGMVIAGVDDALNRYQISEAATNPEGSVLGVTGPSKFEWAMLGVQAALTVADLGSLWKEVNAGRVHFTEAEPQVRQGEEQPHITENENQPGEKENQSGERENQPDPHETGPADVAGGPSKERLHEEAVTLQESMKDPENIHDVLEEDLAKEYDYQVSIESEGEQHTYYHRRDGRGWCRASPTAYCGYAFGNEIEEALARVRQSRRPSRSGKPSENYVANELGPNFKDQMGFFEGDPVKGRGKFGMSIADFGSVRGRRTVVEVKNIDLKFNMDTGFVDLRDQVGGYLSNVENPDQTKFLLFMDIRGQQLPPGGFHAIIDSVGTGTGHVFDNIYLITEVGLVVF